MEVDGGASDEGSRETPGHAYEKETEGPAEDGRGGRIGRVDGCGGHGCGGEEGLVEVEE